MVAVVLATAFGGGASASSAATVNLSFLQGEQLVTIPRDGSGLQRAMEALLAGPTAAERQREITTAIPSGTPLRAASVTAGIATIDLGEKFATGTNADSLTARVTQVVLTATAVPGVRSVRLLVKGATPLGLFPGYVATVPIKAKDAPGARRPAPRPAGAGAADQPHRVRARAPAAAR